MLADTIRILRELDPRGLPRPELEELIAALSAAENAIVERKFAAMAALDDLDDGGQSSSTVIRSKGKVSQKKATRSARTAKKLQTMPRTRTRLARGEITEEHANAAAEAAERTGDPDKADRELQPTIGAPADLFEKRSRAWADAHEAIDAVETRHQRQRRNRKIIFGTDNADGSFSMYGTTDTTEGADLKKAIQAEADRLYKADGGREGAAESGRTDDQRRLDALVNLIKRGAGLASTCKAKRPHPRHRGIVRIPIDRYLGGTDADATLLGQGRLPSAVTDRIMCDMELSPLIVDAEGSPLWMGRAVRTATDEQWVALIDRDDGCVVCGADPSYCEAHHLDFWEQGGPSDITNLVLLCTRHHHDLHDQNLELVGSESGSILRPRERPKRVRVA